MSDPGGGPAFQPQPGATGPGATGPGATEPDTTGPGTTGPGATGPGATEPDTGEAGTTQPGTTEAGGLDGRLSEVRHLLTEATHRLLGDTIVVSDEEWRAGSRLPGWTRGHVGTHIARQAEGLCRLVEWARTGERQDMYASTAQRDRDIEAGADRSGLDLQIDLDTSAGRLAEGFETLDAARAWDGMIVLRGGIDAPARMLPLVRLSEVVLHHVDLALGFGVDDVEPTAAGWLLEWASFRLAGRTEFPALRLAADTGEVAHIGAGGDEPRLVRGSAARLLGWLTGRAGPEQVDGADGLVLPPY